MNIHIRLWRHATPLEEVKFSLTTDVHNFTIIILGHFKMESDSQTQNLDGSSDDLLMTSYQGANASPGLESLKDGILAAKLLVIGK